MKASTPPRTITLEMTEEEATVICALAGGVTWNFDNKAGQIIHDLWACLNAELPERDESFSDFFVGDVSTKSMP